MRRPQQRANAGRLVAIDIDPDRREWSVSPNGLHATMPQLEIFRARPSTLDGTPTPVKGLRTLADEALRRLGIWTGPTRLEQAYGAGRTTQVPSGRRIAVDKEYAARSAIAACS